LFGICYIPGKKRLEDKMTLKIPQSKKLVQRLIRTLFVSAILVTPSASYALDQVKVGIFPVSSSLPFFVALEKGYFKEQEIEPVQVRMSSGTLIIGAMLAGDLETAAALVTTESINVNSRTPNPILYLSLNGQNEQNRQETFVVRNGLDVSSMKDLKGKATKIMAASGPANVSFAKAVLKANGMEEGKDYTMTDLAVNLHAGAMQAGTFDAGFTLEPVGTILKKSGGAKEIEGGVIATYILGRKDALAFVAGSAVTSKFTKDRPDVAKRWAVALRKALSDIASDPSTRDYLKNNTQVPSDLVRDIGIPKMFMIDQLTEENKRDFQTYIDFAVSQGIIKDGANAVKYLVTLDK
jgi:NitT/TauT family transport system substrate-binding protein